MNNEQWGNCERVAKSGDIKLVADLLLDEIKSRLHRSIDPDIDIRDLIISTYNPTNGYTVKGFITVLVEILSVPGVKAKQAE